MFAAPIGSLVLLVSLTSTANSVQDEKPKKYTSAEDPLNDDETRAKTERIKTKTLQYLEQLLDEFPDQAQSHILMSRYYARLGDGTRALESLEKARELAPENPEVYVALGWVEWKRREGEPAAKWWYKAIELEPDVPNIRNYLARVLLSLDRKDEAIPLLEADLKRNPGSYESHFLLGQIHQLNQDFEKAREAYLKTLKVYPTFANAYYCLATVCSRLGEMEEAKEYRKKFRAHKTEFYKDFDSSILSFDDLSGVSEVLCEICRGAAEMYMAAQRSDRAEELWQWAIEVQNDDVASRTQYATFAMRTGKLDTAKRLLTELIELEPKVSQHSLNLGRVAVQEKNFEEAEKRFRTVCDLEPAKPAGYRALAQLYLQFQRKIPQARDYAQSCTNLSPIAPHYYLLGVACARTGDKQGAIDNIQRAVDLAPDNPTYRQVLQQLTRNR